MRRCLRRPDRRSKTGNSFPPEDTDKARQAIGNARQEAQRLNHEYIGTEHILLGVLQVDTAVGTAVLMALGIDRERLRAEVERVSPVGPNMVTTGQIPFTRHAKEVLESSIEEATRLEHDFLGTEHLLLGILAVHGSKAAGILRKLGVELESFQDEVLRFLSSESLTPPMPSSDLGEAKAALAARAYETGLYAVATGLYEELFRDHPNMAEGFANRNRMRAIVSVLLAGLGRGDGARLTVEQRKSLRERASLWLKTEIAASGQAIEQGRALRSRLAALLAAWSRDDALSRVRAPEGLAKLAAEERSTWEALWREADDLACEPGEAREENP